MYQPFRHPLVTATVLWLLCGVLFFPAFQAQAQIVSELQQDRESAETRKFGLSGTVVNSVTGEPIRRALVQVHVGLDRETLTDSEGHFQFGELPEGGTILTATKPGFFSEQEITPGPSSQTMAQIGPNTAPVILKLIPEGVIFGRVHSVDGEAIEGIPIKAIFVRIVDGHKRWEQRANAMTNEDGEFRMANLIPGSYYLAAGPTSRYRLAVSGGAKGRESGYVQVYYPGAAEIGSATPVDLLPGQRTEADFSLKPEPIFQVSGVVAGFVSHQGVSLRLTTPSGDSLSLPMRFDSETGEFQTRIPAGSYTLRADAQDDLGRPISTDLPLTVASDVRDIHLVLGPTASIPVVTRFESTKLTPAPARLTNRRNFQLVTVRLSPSGPSLEGADYWSGQGKDSAVAAVRGVRPGRYSVNVDCNGEWYVQSAQRGETDLLREDLTVVAGGESQPIEIVLRDDVATLSGTISSAERQIQGAVLLIAEHNSRSSPKMTFSSSEGEFQFGGLAPGDYAVLAFDRISDLEYANPEVLSAYLPRANHITLQSNDRATVALDLTRVEK